LHHLSKATAVTSVLGSYILTLVNFCMMSMNPGRQQLYPIVEWPTTRCSVYFIGWNEVTPHSP